jgi:glycosyltransferase involved in cell wall biosynthesis
MRKILWIFPNKSKQNSGIYKYNLELKKLVKKRSNITVFYNGKKPQYFFTFINKFIYLPLFLFLNSFKFDCVIYPEEGFAFLKVFSFSKQNKIIIHDYRKVFSDKNKINFYEVLKQLYLDFNFLFINRYEKIIVPSQFTKELLTKYIPEIKNKINIIPNIISFNDKIKKKNKQFKFIKMLSKKFLIIMCISSEESRKNTSFIYEIAKYTNKMKFIIVGNVKRNNISNNIYNFKNLSESNLSYIFKNSDFFLDVSLFEGFGRSLLEAQYFGVEVICFDTKSNKEILLNTVTYMKKNISAKAVCGILNKKKIKNGKKKFKNALNFSPKKIYSKFNKQINEI